MNDYFIQDAGLIACVAALMLLTLWAWHEGSK